MKPCSKPPVKVVDSITELTALDAGCIAVSGSHGGMSAARYAVAAGVGLDDAGIAGLALLQSHGLAACGVSHHSARIGDARSTLESGVVQHVNAAARSLGVEPGMRCEHIAQLLSA